MLQKQDRQCLFTKKFVLLCVFLFFSLATPESQEGAGTQQPESTRREEQREVSRKIYIVTRYDTIQSPFYKLKRLYEALAIGNETDLVKKYQVFQLVKTTSSYAKKLSVTKDYLSIQENADRVERIEERLETDENCSICFEVFTNINGEGKIFVSGCNNEVPHIFHYYCYLPVQEQRQCPYCKECSVALKVEEILVKHLTGELIKTRRIDHLEKITDNPSRWVLHIRDKINSKKTGTATEDWVIVDEPESERMEVLEINLEKPKDLEKQHIALIEEFKFQMIKFNADQEAREIFLVVLEHRNLHVYHKGRVVFDEVKAGCCIYPVELRIESLGYRGNQVIDLYGKVNRLYREIFVFNKENIEYLKETKGLFVFGNSFVDAFIGLEGDEIIPKEDLDEILITNDDVGLACDNVKNLAVRKTNHYSLLSPINQLKMAQIRDMKDNTKIQLEWECIVLREEDCFLFPLFDLGATTIHVAFDITLQMMKGECCPFQGNVKELNELFAGVEIRGEELEVMFNNYAVILLLYFSENALKVKVLGITLFDGMGNYGLDIMQGFINNQIISKQQTQTLCLGGEVFSFGSETKLLENINTQVLIIKSLKKDTHENFICKEDGLSTIISGLEELILEEYAIKHLLYFKKGINEINKLLLFFIFEDNEKYQWALGIFKRIEENGIIFHIPSMDSLTVLAGNDTKKLESKLKGKIVFSQNNLVSY